MAAPGSSGGPRVTLGPTMAQGGDRRIAAASGTERRASSLAGTSTAPRESGRFSGVRPTQDAGSSSACAARNQLELFGPEVATAKRHSKELSRRL